ncbi:trans-sialidase [Nitrosopumilus sp.]|nr:trans-sialidase [Nitrosopumilus sp.]
MLINPELGTKTMAAAKKQTKKDLEEKIAELEAKLNKLADQLTAKPAETKPAEVKPAETKPAEVKPAETAKPKPTLPKGSTPKPKEAPKPAETKPAEVKAAETKTAPATLQDALENAYMDAPMTDFHQYRAKVTGYTPAPNRYFVRGTAPVGKVPTKNWNDQKATVTGYTQPSDQYFATRARLAYHPPTKRFGTFSGVAMTVDGVALKATTTEAPKPKEVPKLTAKEEEKLARTSYAAEMKAQGKGSLPKGF